MSSYYENNASWSTPGRQPSWEQQAPPPRSGTASASRDESTAFSAQFEEIDRATDNLVKSGKFMAGMPGRRESMPMMNRGAPEYDARMGGPSRHHSVSEHDGSRSSSAAGLQGFYASQRFQPRQNEAEQMMQAKRRMAAQRERELRNYHQEQQYNRNIPGVKSDRSMSPTTMSEDERRELIARQHRALYGNDSTLYTPDSAATTPRRQSQDVRVGSVSSAVRGPSPQAFDPFGSQTLSGADSVVQMPPREGMPAGIPKSPNSASSPSSNPTTAFSSIDNLQQSGRTSVTSPSGSPPLVQGGKQATTAAGVVPIGTRPAQVPAAPPGMNKRSTTPLPSPLSLAFSANEQRNNSKNARSTSAASNPPKDRNVSGLGAWGSNSGGWGSSKNTLGVQASVWG